MKSMKTYLTFFIFLFIIIMNFGCTNSAIKALELDESQVKIRSMQTRAFDTTNKKMMMQTVISTMQDIDFVIEKADFTLGSISGTKFYKNIVVVMTVTVRPRGEKQMLVRANAQYDIKTIEDPETYQDFFVALEKSLFLTAHQVD